MTSKEQQTLPLDHPLRTTPIHQFLPDIRVPSDDTNRQQQQPEDKNKPLQPHHYNPQTCAPLSTSASTTSNTAFTLFSPSASSTSYDESVHSLRIIHPTPDSALKAQDQAALEARRRVDEIVRRREEVQRAMDKKVKERDTEMKVLSKYQEVKVRGKDILPS